MICFLPELLTHPHEEPSNIRDVVAHIQYVGERIGFEHVGIGSDFDGMASGPRGLDDVSQHVTLVAELLEHGIEKEHVKGIMGLNIVRILGKAESCAQELQESHRYTLHDEIAQVWTDAQKSFLLELGAKRGLSKSV